MIAGDFFQPNRTYAHANYRFQCIHHVTHPITGELQAWGWFGKSDSDGRRHMSFGRGQWDARPWDDITDNNTPPCHCGNPIPAGRTAYCSDPCRDQDRDHGPDHEDTDGGES